MRRPSNTFPDIMPVLTPGKHRNPRRGACFMEFASYLAGEQWSDHPTCTNAMLAELARTVNDLSPASTRSRMTEHIPRVIGLTSDNPELGLRIAARAAAAALPIASFERQRTLALGLLICASITVDPALRDYIKRAMDDAPDAGRWARQYAAVHPSVGGRFATSGAAATVRIAVIGIANACVSDADERLLDLLVSAIDDTESFIAAEGTHSSSESVARDHAEYVDA